MLFWIICEFKFFFIFDDDKECDLEIIVIYDDFGYWDICEFLLK